MFWSTTFLEIRRLQLHGIQNSVEIHQQQLYNTLSKYIDINISNCDLCYQCSKQMKQVQD